MIQTIKYQADCSKLFAKLHDLPYAMWLDSGRPQCKYGRYDIISALPSGVIHATQQSCYYNDQPTQHQHVFALLNDILSTRPKNKHAILPFTGGAIGYVAYDHGLKLENLPAHSIQDIKLPEAVFGFYDWAIVMDHLEKKGYWIQLPSINKNTIKIIQQRLNNEYKYNPEKFKLLNTFQVNLNDMQYSHAFHQVQEHLYHGDCYQINLARRWQAQYTGSTWQLYQHLRQQSAAPFATYFNLPQGAILSFSPEQFLQIENNQVTTKPIKGTIARHKNQIEDRQNATKLLTCSKNRAENTMIVDLLRNDLGKVCAAGSVQVPKLCELESFNNVHHLVSTVTGNLASGFNQVDCWQQCFPGGSITGAPKYRVMQIINELEPHHRAVFCGSIGFISDNGHMNSNIAIRTLISDLDTIYCYAGGGIVVDSKCNDEFHETEVKVKTLLNGVSQLETENCQ
jgi:para-aminobenzoate synthetase component I